MIKNIATLSGFLSLLFIVIYTSMYLIRDLYSYTSNIIIKKYMNKLLSIFSRYNSLYLIIFTIFSLIHFSYFINFSSIINSGYVTLFVIFFIVKITFFPSKKNKCDYSLNILSYLLFASLIIHIYIQ